ARVNGQYGHRRPTTEASGADGRASDRTVRLGDGLAGIWRWTCTDEKKSWCAGIAGKKSTRWTACTITGATAGIEHELRILHRPGWRSVLSDLRRRSAHPRRARRESDGRADDPAAARGVAGKLPRKPGRAWAWLVVVPVLRG